MRLGRHLVNACRIDPTIVEIEQSADRNREVDGFVVPAYGVQRFHICRRDPRRITIHLVHKTEQRFFFLLQSRILQVMQHAPNQLFTA